jgi:hypothetical protein
MPAVVAAERSRESVGGATAEAHTASRRSLVNIVSSRDLEEVSSRITSAAGCLAPIKYNVTEARSRI